MSRPPRSGGGTEVARGAGYAAFLGAALIGVAVIIGIVLLQIGDKNDNGPAGASTTKKTTPTTQPHKTQTSTRTTPTSPTTPQRPASAVNVIVLNGGGVKHAATNLSNALKVKGYTQQGTPNDWTGHRKAGDSVYCRAGLDREGSALAIAVGPNATLHIPFPKPAPPFSAGRDCVVVVGS